MAIVVRLLLQVPPAVASLNVEVRPTHADFVPVIEDGNAMMVTLIAALALSQPAIVCET